MEGTLPRPRIRAHASLSPTQGPGQRAQVSLTCDSQEELTDVGVDLLRAGHLLAVSRDCAGMWAHLTQKSAAHMATLAHAAAPAHSHPWPPRPTWLPLPTATPWPPRPMATPRLPLPTRLPRPIGQGADAPDALLPPLAEPPDPPLEPK